MKRTKSAFTLRNLAMSIKQSIQLDEQKTAKKQSFPLRPSKSVAHCMPKERNSDSGRAGKTLSREQKTNRIFVLDKQIINLEKQLKQEQTCEKDHSKELQAYDRVSKMQLQSQKDIKNEKMVNQQIRNQILMLHEEIHSLCFNIDNRMAEKEYHQQLIDAYIHQYEAESRLVTKSHEIGQKNEDIKIQIKKIEDNIARSQQSLRQWKEDVEFDLNQHKMKNNIKIIRTRLISLEDKCDDFCNQHNLRKIRELYCLYFKNYSKDHGERNEQADNGIDIFICKKKLVEDFSEYLRQRLVYNKPKCSLVQDYIETLIKMEQIFQKSIHESHKKLHQQFIQELQQLKDLKDQKNKELNHNCDKIKAFNSQIDELFNNESIALIQYMREKNQNTYDLKQIKLKLRESKKEQKVRIHKIKESFIRIKSLEQIIEKSNAGNTIKANKFQIQQLSQHLFSSELQLQQLQNKYFKLLKDKNAIEDRINQAITKWREIDEKKIMLKSLYKQLESLNSYQEKQDFKSQILPKCIQQPLFKHSKNTSLSSLQQSKSILSLSNPYKKIIERSTQLYQPILSSCQMILSNKLTKKDQQFKCYQPKSSKQIKQNKSNLMRTQSKSIINRQSTDKENNKSAIKSKKPLVSTQAKGKISINQRQSLSNLLISRFNR